MDMLKYTPGSIGNFADFKFRYNQMEGTKKQIKTLKYEKIMQC